MRAYLTLEALNERRLPISHSLNYSDSFVSAINYYEPTHVNKDTRVAALFTKEFPFLLGGTAR